MTRGPGRGPIGGTFNYKLMTKPNLKILSSTRLYPWDRGKERERERERDGWVNILTQRSIGAFPSWSSATHYLFKARIFAPRRQIAFIFISWRDLRRTDIIKGSTHSSDLKHSQRVILTAALACDFRSRWKKLMVVIWSIRNFYPRLEKSIQRNVSLLLSDYSFFFNEIEYYLYREMISKIRTNIKEIVYKHRFNNATIK